MEKETVDVTSLIASGEYVMLVGLNKAELNDAICRVIQFEVESNRYIIEIIDELVKAYPKPIKVKEENLKVIERRYINGLGLNRYFQLDSTTHTSQEVTSLSTNEKEIAKESESDTDTFIKKLNKLQVLLIGNVIDAVSSFAVSNPKHICILDEVVTSSREYKEGEASGWDDFLEYGRSDVWDRMREQSKASLQYISKKRIPLKKINQMKYLGESINGMYPIERGCFADVRLDRVIEVDLNETNITDQDITALGRACPAMQKLNIYYCRDITDVGLIEFSRYCHGLKEVKMSQCKYITNAGLIEFSKNCRGLNKINLTFCDGIVGGGVEGLSQHCCDLQIIKISYSICTDADLLALSTNCQQLQEIYLDGCEEVTDDGLIEMSKHLSSNKQFRHIDISNCALISDRGVINFSKNCPQLKSFEIRGDNFTDDSILGAAKNCSGLERINIGWNEWVTETSMNAIASNCHGLKSLYVGLCYSISEDSFTNMIENCNNLETISICGNSWVTDRSVNAIAKNCHGLKSLEFRECANINEASFINLTKNCTGLQTILNSRNDWMTNMSMNAIAKNCRDLECIDIDDCHNITDAGILAVLKGCPGMRNKVVRNKALKR